MQSKWKQWIGTIKTTLQRGLQRFPEAMISAVVAAILFIIANHVGDASYSTNDSALETSIINAGLIFLLGFIAFSVKTVLLERYATEKWTQHPASKPLAILLILGALTAYYFNLQASSEFVTYARYVVIFASLFIAFLLIPYLLKRAHFEKYVLIVLLRLAITYLFSSVLLAGFTAIVLTIDALFATEIFGTVMPDLTIVITIVFAPIFFLSFIPRYEEDMAEVQYVPFLRILINGIVLPILSVYTIVLVIYFLTILISMSWPKGIVSNMVLYFSLISTLVLFITYPIRELNRWSSFFVKVFPVIILPMLLMMFVSVWIRVNAYGITESRYMVIAIGIWLFGVMLYYSISRNVRNIWLAMTFIVFLWITVISPFNAFEVAKMSQNTRFEAILERNQMIENDKLIQAPKKVVDNVSTDDKTQLQAIMEYFDQNHKLSEINALPSDFKTDQTLDYFGFEFNSYEAPTTNDKQAYFNVNMQYEKVPTILLDKQEVLIDFSGKSFENQKFTSGAWVIDYNSAQKSLKIKKGKLSTETIELNQIVEEIYQKTGNQNQVTMEKLKSKVETESYVATFQFKNFSGYETNKQVQSIDNIDFYLMLSEK